MPIKIFIDQGHNPSGTFNSGAEANGVTESEVNYQVGIYLQNLLNSDSRFEARVSRPTPDTVLGTNNTTSLQERVRLANEWPANYFISIHCNSNPDPDINGTEVYIYRTGTQSNWLADAVLNAVTETVGTNDNGVRVNPSLYVLRRTNMHSILIELAYVTNLSDAMKLRDNQYQFANGIYLGIKRYFGFE
ncbi:cell wall hydrolase [Anaerocolumna sedimenticola]|uniref:Cell wall hydrolase n=1 Tax=Anaerocolumna sedimenticola TaxID=2696063 RepID=A0A6P1TV55_9FIRM|nr:N-acetylmuramoyl-L-alanine amidase [Anaerocolumna sedimenticola]QHQ63596.1 cell wall hydrolase [Anaerocolumna sedimenticola]